MVGDLSTSFGGDKRREGVHVRLDGEFGERKRHTGEDINDNLELLAFLILWSILYIVYHVPAG